MLYHFIFSSRLLKLIKAREFYFLIVSVNNAYPPCKKVLLVYLRFISFYREVTGHIYRSWFEREKKSAGNDIGNQSMPFSLRLITEESNEKMRMIWADLFLLCWLCSLLYCIYFSFLKRWSNILYTWFYWVRLVSLF